MIKSFTLSEHCRLSDYLRSIPFDAPTGRVLKVARIALAITVRQEITNVRLLL